MANYDDCRFLNLSVRMAAKQATVWAGETWQIGIRLAVKSSPVLDYDDGRVELPAFSVQDAAVSRQTTEFDIEQGFTGRGSLAWNITDADQDNIANVTQDWLASIAARTANYYVLDTIRLYPTGKDGKSRTAPSVYWPRTTAGNPSGLKMLPPDVALAVSWQTATRGPKGRGRVYLGAPSATDSDDGGRIAQAQAQAVASASADWLEAIRGIGGLTSQACFTPIIWHRVGDRAGVEDGTYGSVIRQVRVNNHYDTQRRRDRQVPPTWSTADLT